MDGWKVGSHRITVRLAQAREETKNPGVARAIENEERTTMTPGHTVSGTESGLSATEAKRAEVSESADGISVMKTN